MPHPERFRTLEEVLSRRQPDLTVLMERVHKPHNLSAIVRNCDAAGVLEVHAVPPDDDLSLPELTSGGTAKWVDVRTHPDLDAAVERLREEELRMVAAHPADDAVDYREVDYTRPTAIVLGTELHGLTDEAVAASDLRATIPMEGFVASLNVSVAAALFLFEARRQREEAGFYRERRLPDERYRRLLFEWAHPRVAERCREVGAPYPPLGPDGEIRGPVPR